MTVSYGFCKVIPLGFEPKTHSLEGCCSIQLSYETIKIGRKGSKKNAKSQIFKSKIWHFNLFAVTLRPKQL